MITSVTAPASGTCVGKACWQEKPACFNYKDKAATPNGFQQLALKSGADGRAKITAKATGANLALPALPFASSDLK